MKNCFYHFAVVTALLLSAQFARAQWVPQAIGQFQNSDWTDQIRIADSSHVWAGVSNYAAYAGWVTDALPRLAHTTDGGQSWQILTIPGTEGYLGWGLSLLGPDTAFWSLNRRASPNDRLYRTVDGGQSWELVVQDTAAGYQVHFFDALNGLIYRGPYNMKITSDGGLTWTAPANVPSNLANQGIFNYPGGETEVEGDYFLAGLEDGKFFKSTDRGHSWQAFSTPLNSPLSDLAFENADIGLGVSMFTVYDTAGQYWSTGGQSSRLIRTTDGGQSWTEIPRAQLPFPNAVLFISAMAATGASGTYVMEAGVGGSGSYTTFRSTDGGLSWQEVSVCPDERLGTIEFKSPELGWAGSSIVQSATDAMFFKWGQPPAPKSVFTVDLGDTPPSPLGVHLAVDIYGWDPAAVLMTNAGGSLWTAELTLPAGVTVHYRFVNGITLSEAETVPGGCGTQDNGISVRQAHTPDCKGMVVSPVLFGHCLPDGELAPQISVSPCDTSYLICENFDNYLPGKIGPQSAIWTSYGCNYDGTEGDDCDVDLSGYSNGFTHYSGQWALHPNSIYSDPLGQSIELNLGGWNTGVYDLSMKMYVPAQRSSFFVLYFSDTYSSVDLSFNPNGTLTYNKYSGTDFSYVTDTLVSYPVNQWFEVRMGFDLNQQQRSFWLDSTLIFSASDPDIVQLLNANFQAYGTDGEMFVDDLILRDLDAVAAHEPPQVSTPLLDLWPNPATDYLTLRLNANAPGSPLTALLLNPQGQALQQQPALNGASFDVRKLPAGIYGLVLRDESGRMVEVKRWMKM